MTRILQIKKIKSTPEEIERCLEKCLETVKQKIEMKREKDYKAFQERIYQYLISYKEENITKECGTYKGEKRKEFLPESYWNEEVPAMLYPRICEKVKDIQKSEFRYKPHLFAFKHVASSQTACVNLFVPILESRHANEILKSIDACPKDFKEIDKDALKNGYRFEFWDSTNENDKGLLGDHSKQAGTDADVAIAYINNEGEHCLWLIEHKLTEQEFTTCGGYKSKGNTDEGKNHCLNCTMKEIIDNHKLCYYDREKHYKYWEIMSKKGTADFFGGEYEGKGCPFRGGMNQLWRNQLLAIALEKDNPYKFVSFSVVTHPDNCYLDDSMNQYRKLVKDSPKFSSFKSSDLINASKKYPKLLDWVKWYEEVYYGKM